MMTHPPIAPKTPPKQTLLTPPPPPPPSPLRKPPQTPTQLVPQLLTGAVVQRCWTSDPRVVGSNQLGGGGGMFYN